MLCSDTDHGAIFLGFELAPYLDGRRRDRYHDLVDHTVLPVAQSWAQASVVHTTIDRGSHDWWSSARDR